MGRVEGKVVFVTGAARGQGRAHAVRFAEEGAAIVAVDICEQVPGVTYPMSSKDDLEETAELVKKAGGSIVTAVVDVRDDRALADAVSAGVREFGHIDTLLANAGIVTAQGQAWEMSDQAWQQMLDINLTGVWRSVKAVAPEIIKSDRSGSVVLTSSYTGLKGEPFIAHYAAAKHGVIGLMRALAHELGPYKIRCNAICPGNTATPMLVNDFGFKLMRPDLEDPTRDDAEEVFQQLTLLDVGLVEAEDIANAALFLASDESRYITGVALPVDGGWYAK